MVFESVMGVGAAPFLVETGAADPGDLVRGAIGGAFIIGAAFLSGFAVFRRSAAAVCALLMVLAAAAIEFSLLGFFRFQSDAVFVFLQGLLGARC